MLFNESMEIVQTTDVGTCDAILLWGGEDIASYYYGEPPHPLNQNKSGKPSRRDQREWAAMVAAIDFDVPIIGVCRGAQFMCAFAGGSLIQHMSGHHGDHDVTIVETGEVYQTSSCHHQAMKPGDVEHTVLAKAGDILEAVYFPNIRGFAVQGHPEWMEKRDPYVKWCMNQISTLLLEKEYVS